MIRRGTLVCLLILLAAACTESDPQLLEEIGVVRLFLIDPVLDRPNLADLQVSAFEEPDIPVQVAEWKVLRADLEVEDAIVDLASGEGCRFTDTPLVTPVADGTCESGIVVESAETGTEVRLVLEVEMRVRRAWPTRVLSLEPGADADADGIPNDGDGSGSALDHPCTMGLTEGCDDNCPLVPNGDQADDDEDGIGNACSLGLNARDSDADGVSDGSDNCLWEYNPSQADTRGSFVNGSLIPDGIGDACEEQTAAVYVDGASSFELILGPEELPLAIGGIGFITVDFRNTATLECTWANESCTLQATPGFCAPTSGTAALLGCPGGS